MTAKIKINRNYVTRLNTIYQNMDNDISREADNDMFSGWCSFRWERVKGEIVPILTDYLLDNIMQEVHDIDHLLTMVGTYMASVDVESRRRLISVSFESFKDSLGLRDSIASVRFTQRGDLVRYDVWEYRYENTV